MLLQSLGVALKIMKYKISSKLSPKLYLISYNNGSNTDILQAFHWVYFCYNQVWYCLSDRMFC